MGNVGIGELLIIFLIALLIFGAKRIPEIARSLGRGIGEFRNALRDGMDAKDVEIEEKKSADVTKHEH